MVIIIFIFTRRKRSFFCDLAIQAWYLLHLVLLLIYLSFLFTLFNLVKSSLRQFSSVIAIYFLVPIMLKSVEGWDQVAAFVALTMCHKMEIAQERPIAAATQHPMPDLAIPPFLLSATQQRKQKTIQTGPLWRHPAANSPSSPEILRS